MDAAPPQCFQIYTPIRQAPASTLSPELYPGGWRIYCFLLIEYEQMKL
jgi:hypothetical protein